MTPVEVDLFDVRGFLDRKNHLVILHFGPFFLRVEGGCRLQVGFICFLPERIDGFDILGSLRMHRVDGKGIREIAANFRDGLEVVAFDEVFVVPGQAFLEKEGGFFLGRRFPYEEHVCAQRGARRDEHQGSCQY